MNFTDFLHPLKTQASKATEMIKVLDEQIEEVKKDFIAQSDEIALLRAEIEVWKQRLIHAECNNDVTHMKTNQPIAQGDEIALLRAEIEVWYQRLIQANDVTGNKSTKSGPCVSRLDFRVGKIISAKKHPNADNLYVEVVDVGEKGNRTVVSDFVKFIPVKQLHNRAVVLLCNLKPIRIRGILSEAMVMCARTPGKVEILSPPLHAVAGDRIICEEFPGDSDRELKKSIFEQVARDLKTDGQKRAGYKGKLLVVSGKGCVVAKSLINVQIK
uniref:tRNA-binding domain-containing protein n=1 Tax=Strigamia maritima TaxID=126957 RepID=T1JFE5_STRMM